ncbi:XRE family transcriptional regulator [Actinomadura darangshiensis]|uniref:XRE family transcriptional regulator n=1 Tax=Actinomadura darangshiensis TaxID=705336 RepID=A0A4V2YVQ5_9ACTN|nr:helix-turn-helix transcriptional regulator [Actinomadura darangshiensis]TDD82357.1 XRE family transcriptional regulator [Actinomadura darangshiensis]
MPDAPLSTARRRKIGRVLRQFREEASYTLKTAGAHFERSPSSLSQIENGTQRLRLRDLGYILDQYNVPTDVRAALMTLNEQDRQPGWWDAYRDLVTPEALDRVSLEHDASRIVVTETTFIPGLLQTEAYARTVIRGITPKHQATVIERFVEFRLMRQSVLNKAPATRLEVVLDEAALRRMRGGRQVMRSQLRRLVNQSELENVQLNVLPLAIDAGSDYAGQFELLEIGSPPMLTVVLTEHLAGQAILESGPETAQYRGTFEQIRSLSLTETASRDLINEIISEL